MMDLLTITERLGPLVDETLARMVTSADQVTGWDFSIGLVPQPQGLVPVSLLTITVRSPLLGHPDLCNTNITPGPNALLTQLNLDAAVRNTLESLRSEKAKIMATANGGPA